MNIELSGLENKSPGNRDHESQNKKTSKDIHRQFKSKEEVSKQEAMFFSEDLLEQIVLNKNETGPNKKNDEARHEHQVHQARHHMSAINTLIGRNSFYTSN